MSKSLSDSQFGPLFHGSGHDFKVGDVVEPREALLGRGAYATRSAELASTYAEDTARLAPQPKWWDGDEEPRQGKLFGTVYKVARMEGDEPTQDPLSQGEISQKGYRVTGVERHVIPDWKSSW